MSDILAKHISYGALFSLLLFHCWINLFLYLNRYQASNYLNRIREKENITQSAFPGVLYTKLIPEREECDMAQGYSENKSPIWLGTKNGVYLKAFTTSHSCDFKVCIDRYAPPPVYPGYRSYCYVESQTQVCCNFSVKVPINNRCQTIQDSCSCSDFFVSNANKSDYEDETRDIIEFLPISPMPLNRLNSKKICEKKITNYTLFDSKCEGGVYCYDYLCIRNMSSCPDYSEIFPAKLKKPISSINFNINTMACSYFQLSKNVSTRYEDEYFVSKMRDFNNLGCPSNNETYHNDDIIPLNKFSQLEFYKSNGIYKEIYEKIDRFIVNENDKYSFYLNDTMYITGNSHFNININEVSCKRPELLEILNSANAFAYDLYSGHPLALKITDGIVFGIFVISLIIAFSNIKSKGNPNFNIYGFKWVLIINLLFFFYNLTIYFIFMNDATEGHLKNFELFKTCFMNENFVNYMERIKFGLENHRELFHHSLKRILVENSIIIVIYLIMISNFTNLFSLVLCKQPED